MILCSQNIYIFSLHSQAFDKLVILVIFWGDTYSRLRISNNNNGEHESVFRVEIEAIKH